MKKPLGVYPRGFQMGAGLGFEPRTIPLKHWDRWIIVDLSLTI
jgi:hypothetical protein